MTMVNQPVAIIAACFLFQTFLVSTFPISSIGVGANFVMEALRLAATAAFLNVATLYMALLLIGTKRITLERTDDSFTFECIFGDMQCIKNQSGSICDRASTNDSASPQTSLTASTKVLHSPSYGLYGRKRSAPTQIDGCLDGIIETPYRISGGLNDDMSSFSPSNLRSPYISTDGNTVSFHDVKPATPPVSLGHKMMTTIPVTIGSPPPGNSIRSVKIRRSTPFYLPRKMHLRKS